MRTLLALVTAVIASAATASPEDVTTFERGMATADFHAATRAADRILDEARAKNPQPHQDPLYRALAARLILRQSGEAAALPWLWNLDIAALPADQQSTTLIDRAQTYLATNFPEKAAEDLAQLRSRPLPADQRRRFLILLAESQLESNPAHALATVQPLITAESAGARWEALLVAARAQLLLHRAVEAEQLAVRAWQDSAFAPADDHAIVPVSLVRAAIAAERGQGDLELAMLDSAHSADNHLSGATQNQLPSCGKDGVSEDDWARVALWSDTDRQRAPMIVGASRPQAVRPFLAALTQAHDFYQSSKSSGGTIAYLRCRVGVNASYRPPLAAPNSSDLWMIEHGIYQHQGDDADVETVNRLADAVAAIEARMGSASPALIGPRLDLRRALLALKAADPQTSLILLPDLQRKISEGLKAMGGPHVLPEVPVNSAPSETAFLDLYRAHLGELRPEEAYDELSAFLAMRAPVPPSVTEPLLRAVLARLPANLADPRRTALLLRLARLPGNDQARQLRQQAALPSNLCAALEVEPKLQTQTMSDEDFPKGPLSQGLQGVTVFEFEITPEGRIGKHRLIFASPTSQFAPAAERRLPEFRFEPGRDGARPRACEGLIQSFRWKLPEGGDFESIFAPTESLEADQTT
jgi:hypothetical protein